MKYTKKEIKDKVFDVLNSFNVNREDSELFSDYIVQVEMYGVKSHGLKTLKSHLKKIKEGKYNLNPSFEVKKASSAFAVIDGDNSIGVLSAIKCVDYAVEQAKKSGVFTVFSFNNNTFGAAFYYALRGAKQGCICLIMSNSPAQMAAIGGCEKILGTNPFAIAVPAKKNHPLVVDMATSVVAKSKINDFLENNIPIPEGWALDSNGNPTTDAKAALNGFMLPMSGFKGYGISMMIDVVSGVVSGASYLGNVGRFYSQDNKCMNIGSTIVVIDPELVYGPGFCDEMDSYIDSVRSGKTAEGKKIILPGDDRIQNYEYNLENGIDVQEEIWRVE